MRRSNSRASPGRAKGLFDTTRAHWSPAAGVKPLPRQSRDDGRRELPSRSPGKKPVAAMPCVPSSSPNRLQAPPGPRPSQSRPDGRNAGRGIIDLPLPISVGSRQCLANVLPECRIIFGAPAHTDHQEFGGKELPTGQREYAGNSFRPPGRSGTEITRVNVARHPSVDDERRNDRGLLFSFLVSESSCYPLQVSKRAASFLTCDPRLINPRQVRKLAATPWGTVTQSRCVQVISALSSLETGTWLWPWPSSRKVAWSAPGPWPSGQIHAGEGVRLTD